MNSNFPKALKFVLNEEGLWGDDPRDPGGATMEGITLETYREYKRNQYITKDQLHKIPDNEVSDIYRKRFWNVVRADDMPNGIDFLLFDFGVNAGTGRSAKFIQEAVKVPIDGVIGNQTISAVKAANVMELITTFTEMKKAYYKGLKLFPIYGKGWLKRVDEAEVLAKSMV